jgi:hypothetical protein
MLRGMTLWVRKCSSFEEERLAGKQASGRPQDLADIDPLR